MPTYNVEFFSCFIVVRAKESEYLWAGENRRLHKGSATQTLNNKDFHRQRRVTRALLQRAGRRSWVQREGRVWTESGGGGVPTLRGWGGGAGWGQAAEALDTLITALGSHCWVKGGSPEVRLFVWLMSLRHEWDTYLYVSPQHFIPCICFFK